MNIKPIQIREMSTYIVDINEYPELIKELNKNNMLILQISPTYVAGMISNRFVIQAIRKT